LRWLEGWDQVGTSIGCDVEDRIDSEWEHREGVLGTEKPHKGHSQILNVLISHKLKYTALSSTSSSRSSSECLVDHNSVCDSCRNEGRAVREFGPS
jgi:hypothetical protein